MTTNTAPTLDRPPRMSEPSKGAMEIAQKACEPVLYQRPCIGGDIEDPGMLLWRRDYDGLIGRVAAALDAFAAAAVTRERERCERVVAALENKLWGGQRQIGFDDAKELAITAIRSGEQP